MRIRLAHAVGTLLILGAFVLPATDAKTGDATCASEETWFTDAEGDGGYAVDGPGFPLSGELDIESFTLTETGDTCDSIIFTLNVADNNPVFSLDGSAESVVITVDPTDPDGAPDFTMVYTFVDGGDSSAALMKDGTAVTEGVTGDTDGSDASLTLEAPKSTFGNLASWAGVDAEVTAAFATSNPASALTTQAYTQDTATSPDTFLVNFGLDSDNDGIPDVMEIELFGDITTSDGNGDTDGDGESDRAEIAAGTDPNDETSCTCPPAPPAPTFPTVTHADTDGEFGMGEEETLEEDEAYSFKFTEAGEFAYHDGQNDSAAGHVMVESGEDSDGPQTHVVTITADGFDPEDLDIHQNDTVIFVNEDTAAHSVQSGHGHEGEGGLDFTKFSDESGYTMYAGAGALAVIVLAAIALLARWKA